MIACTECHRLRRPNGLHICLAVALSRRLDSGTGHGVVTAKTPIRSENYRNVITDLAPHNRSAGPLPVSAFSLPGDGPAARVWNALVEGKR